MKDLKRRSFHKWLLQGLCAASAATYLSKIAKASRLIAARIWPASDYSRITLESDAPILYQSLMLDSPLRLVVDLSGIDLTPELHAIIGQVGTDDPYVKSARLGQTTLHIVRIVFDLRQEMNAQLYTVDPVLNYQYRLLMDLYPLKAPDPLQSVIDFLHNDVGSCQDLDASLVAPAQTSQAEQDCLQFVTTPKEKTPNDSPQTDALADLIALDTRTNKPALDQAPRPKPKVATTTQPPRLPGSIPPAQNQSAKTNATLSKPQASAPITIAIDPGHGGEDPGAIGPSGLYEKHVVLAIALRLRELLLTKPGVFRVLLTRDKDFFVPLYRRVEKARAVNANLMISIHADAFITPKASGASVFVLSTKGASSSAARWLAKKENASDDIGGVAIAYRNRNDASVLLDLSTTGQIRESKKLGTLLIKELDQVGSLHKSAVEQASFAVLKAPDVPSVLVETAFISNPEEEAKLATNRYQTLLAQALAQGIRRFHHV